MDLSTKSRLETFQTDDSSKEFTPKSVLTKTEIEANNSMLESLLAMKNLDKDCLDITSDSLLGNLLYITEVRNKIVTIDDESPSDRKNRKSRERCRRYRARQKEKSALGEQVPVKVKLQESTVANEQIILETRAERKRRFARERSKRYRQRLKDKEAEIVPTQHNVVLGETVIGRVEVMETIADKRKRQARERYRKIQNKLLEKSSVAHQILSHSEIAASLPHQELDSKKQLKNGGNRKKSKRKKERKDASDIDEQQVKKTRKIKTENICHDEDDCDQMEEVYSQKARDKDSMENFNESQISMHDYLHLCSLSILGNS